RSHLVRGIEQHSDRPIQECREPSRIPREQRRHPEQRIQEWNEKGEGIRVEDRGEGAGADGAKHAPGVWTQKAEQAAIHQRGVRSATGRMHSSGVTPPWRNEPRYRL